MPIKNSEIHLLLKGGWLSYLVGFYIFSFYLELHNRISVLQSFRFQFVFGAFLGIACLLQTYGKSHKKEQTTTLTKIAITFIVILGLYTVFSYDPENSKTVYIDRVIKFSLISFFIYSAVNKVEDLRVILFFMLLAWLKIGQEGLYGWLTGGMVWENQGIPRLHGVTTMFAHPNSYSGFAVGCLPFSIFLLSCTKSKLLKLGLFALLACALVIVLNTGSRTGYVATIVWLSYYFITLKIGKLKILISVIICGFAALFFTPDHYQERFLSIFTGEEKEGRSSEKRKEIIVDAFQVFLSYPLGVGVSAFPKVRDDMFGRSQDTHNLYLEVLTNTGPIGFLFFSMFIYQLFKMGKKNYLDINKENFSATDKVLLEYLNKAVISFLFIRLLLGFFGMDMYEVYWWLILGYFLAINKLINVNKNVYIQTNMKQGEKR